LIGIVLQARLGSTRLPGKMLMEMAGQSLLWHNVERLRRVRNADALVVAIPVGEADEPLARHCLQQGWNVFRGSEEDVLDRYYNCALAFDFAHVVRATGDCPLVDPELTDALIELHLRERADYSSCKDEVGCRVPNGTGLEMFSYESLRRSYSEGLRANHREHINEYIVENPDSFRIAAFCEPASKRCPDLDLTVDTPEDFMFVESIIEHFAGNHDRLTTEAVITHCASVRTQA
jgi:spore coat polysaccharide biosynthesis protein SpsF